MEVDGISVEAADALRGLMLDTVTINSAGRLIITRKNGEQIDAGLVRPPPLTSWPVGSIYFSNKPDNPAAIMGGGVWTIWGAGRVPVGFSAADPEFNAVEKTGGAKTHTLTTAEMPAHNHSGTTTDDGLHHHSYFSPKTATVKDGTTSTLGTLGSVVADTGDTGVHHHSLLMNNTGGDGAHNNLQPYITCYMWKRLPDA